MLRVLTHNVWGLPWPVGSDVGPRVAAIGAALPALRLDAAAFQEAWTQGTRVALAEAGRRAGLVHAFPEPRGPGRGGLLLLSRAPLRAARFVRYALNGFPERVDHADWWGGKGFLVAELETPEGAVALVATHLHAKYAARALDPYVGHRTAQVVQLASALRDVLGPLLVVGDFNFEQRFEEYEVLTGLSGLVDVAGELGRRESTVRWTEAVERDGASEGGARIDYVFRRGGLRASLRPLAIDRVLDAPLAIGGRRLLPSDHAGLVAELELAPGGVAQAASAGAAAQARAESVALARRLLRQGRAQAKQRRRSLRGAGAATLAGAAAVVAAPGPRGALSRRQLLGGGMAALVGLAGCGSLYLSEEVRPDELHAFDATLRELEGFADATDGGAPPAPAASRDGAQR